MKYTNSLLKKKNRHTSNYIVIRKKRLFIYNKKEPRFKISVK